MENEEVISSQENSNDHKSQGITLDEGVDGVNCDAEEKKKMEEREYPIWHRYRHWGQQAGLAFSWPK